MYVARRVLFFSLAPSTQYNYFEIHHVIVHINISFHFIAE